MAEFFRLERYAEASSTSDLCIARAKAGEPAGLAIQAVTQTAGRGSRGRAWVAPPGNLNLSVLLRPQTRPADAGVYSLLAGIAVAQAVQQVLPAAAPMLKWPNDVLLGGAKLAGVLIDASPADDRLDWLVIGIGVNVLHAPEIAGRVTTTLAAHGAEVTANAMADAVLHRLGHWLDGLAAEGASVIHEAWLALAHPIGTKIEIRTAQTLLTGSFAGLSAAGELLLARDNGIERFNTGEILLGPTGN